MTLNRQVMNPPSDELFLSGPWKTNIFSSQRRSLSGAVAESPWLNGE